MSIEGDPREEFATWVAPDSEPAFEPTSVLPEATDKAPETSRSFAQRLCEHITGLSPERPEMVERLAVDRSIIREKYHLPSPEMPAPERERSLRELAGKYGVQIDPTTAAGAFFRENPLVGAAFLDDGRVAVDIDRSLLQSYRQGLDRFEHELVHALQAQRSPQMPIELKEYEAYVANANVGFLREHPEAISEVLFGFFIGASVETYYRLESEKRGEVLRPSWDIEYNNTPIDGTSLRG